MEFLPKMYPFAKTTPNSKAITKNPLSNCRLPSFHYFNGNHRAGSSDWDSQRVIFRLLNNGCRLGGGKLWRASDSYPAISSGSAQGVTFAASLPANIVPGSTTAAFPTALSWVPHVHIADGKGAG
jgi:hypothetical protein